MNRLFTVTGKNKSLTSFIIIEMKIKTNFFSPVQLPKIKKHRQILIVNFEKQHAPTELRVNSNGEKRIGVTYH